MKKKNEKKIVYPSANDKIKNMRDIPTMTWVQGATEGRAGDGIYIYRWTNRENNIFLTS